MFSHGWDVYIQYIVGGPAVVVPSCWAIHNKKAPFTAPFITSAVPSRAACFLLENMFFVFVLVRAVLVSSCRLYILKHIWAEERILKVFGNRVLRRIFGPKRNKIKRGRKVHNEELHNLYSSPSIIIMMR
jgi:hypothetical protein